LLDRICLTRRRSRGAAAGCDARGASVAPPQSHARVIVRCSPSRAARGGSRAAGSSCDGGSGRHARAARERTARVMIASNPSSMAGVRALRG